MKLLKNLFVISHPKWGIVLYLLTVTICVGLSLEVVIPASAAPNITEYPLPVHSSPNFITSGPDGNLWFTDVGGNKIGKITPNGTITEYAIPTNSASGSYMSITSGPDGNLWFTEEYGEKIGKITTSGTITEYPLINYTEPEGITSGPDGNLWFTINEGDGRIGKITTSGTITVYPIQTANSWPMEIASGSDGNLWFTEHNANKIGEITTTGKITEYPIPTNDSWPDGITNGPDGNLWFTEANGNKIGEITTAGKITEHTLPNGENGPYRITKGSDSNLWFTLSSNYIGQITTAGKITTYAIPTLQSSPAGITSGSDSNIWFTEFGADKIGRVNLSSVTTPPTVTPTPTFTTTPTLVPTSTPTPTIPPSQGDGLLGKYYNDTTSNLIRYIVCFPNICPKHQLVLTKVDPTIDFNWGYGSPDPKVHSDHFSAQWTGFVLSQYSEKYTFYIRSDDGSRVWVNGKEIINNWYDHPAQEFTGTITLVKGIKASITVESYEDRGVADAELRWSSPLTPKQVIPQSQLFSH